MKRNIMDTQDLSEIRKLIGDVSAPDTADSEGFNIDAIIAEVEGTVRDIEQGKQQRVENLHAAQSPQSRVEPASTAEQRARFRVVETPLTGTPSVPNAPSVPSTPAAQVPPVGAAAPQTPPQTAPHEPVRPVPQPVDESEDELSEKEYRKQEKRRKKQEKLAQRAQEEEPYEPRDPRVAQSSCLRRARSLAGRSVLVALLFLGVTYLTLAGGMGWPVPALLTYETATVTTVLAMLVMEFIGMLIAVDVIGGGLYALFTGAPDRRTLVSCACLSTVAHGVSIILKPTWGGLLPYCALSLLLLLAAMQDEKARYAGRQRAFKAATLATQPTGIFMHREGAKAPRTALKTDMLDATPFLLEMEKPDVAQRFASVYAPVMLAASVIFALVVSVAQGVPSRFFWALSGLLTMSAPLGLLCASGPAYRNVSRRLLTEGAAIAGTHSAGMLRRSKHAVLTDWDLFPAGSITIDGMRNYGNYSPEKLLSYAAAVTGGRGLEIGRVFSESLREQYGRPVKATNVLQYESGGLSADIGGDSVLVGTAAFLMKLHIRVRDIHGIENGVFVVINNQVAGAFALTYHPSAQTYSALHALRRLRIKPVLTTRDFNITPAMVDSLFELRSGTTQEVSAPPQRAEKDTICGILSHDGIVPFAQLLHSCERLGAAVRTNLSLGVFSGVCGVLLVFYLEHLAAFEALQPKNLLLYLLLWYLPVFLMTLSTRKRI